MSRDSAVCDRCRVSGFDRRICTTSMMSMRSIAAIISGVSHTGSGRQVQRRWGSSPWRERPQVVQRTIDSSWSSLVVVPDQVVEILGVWLTEHQGVGAIAQKGTGVTKGRTQKQEPTKND